MAFLPESLPRVTACLWTLSPQGRGQGEGWSQVTTVTLMASAERWAAKASWIRARAPGEGARRIGSAARPADREILCPHCSRQILPVLRPPDREHADALGLENLDGEQAERSHAQHRGRLPALGFAARDGAHHD